MSDTDIDGSEIAKWDPQLTERVIGMIRPVLKRYFRTRVYGLEHFPPGPSLVVSNHSGGLFALDVPILAADYYDTFGYERPIYTLSHDIFFAGPAADFSVRIGLIRAHPDNAAQALRTGGIVVVFPGGDYDVHRPTLGANTIDFCGRTGYVSTAIEAGVPIVPMVSIGGQETQLFLSRGTWLAQRLGPIARAARSKVLPISFGFPFGLSIIIPPNLPLPAKIITQVLEPIDIPAQFGDHPDIAEVDAHVRAVMQQGIERLGRRRRFPVIG